MGLDLIGRGRRKGKRLVYRASMLEGRIIRPMAIAVDREVSEGIVEFRRLVSIEGLAGLPAVCMPFILHILGTWSPGNRVRCKKIDRLAESRKLIPGEP